MARRSTALTLALLILMCAPVWAEEFHVNGDSIKSYIQVLASDEYQGRGTGTEGCRMAEEYVAAKFRSWGLKPAGENKTYFQHYTVPFFRLEAEPVLEVAGRRFVYEEDFRVARYSGSGDVRAEIVFVGQGIVDTAANRDDYEGLDVKGKIVLAMRPTGEGAYPMAGGTSDSALVWAAKSRGARGLLVFSPSSERRRVPMRLRLSHFDYDPNFIAMAIDQRVASYIFKKAGKSEREIMRMGRRARGFATGVEAHLQVRATFDPERPARNVLAMLPGRDRRLKNEYVIIGGHLDHLGTDFRGTVYNGADDNASGIATVLEVARAMVAHRVKPLRTIIFAGWSGEEMGLLGSSHYASHPVWPLEKTVAYINLDMVGRGNGKVRLSGEYYAPEVWELIEAALGDSLEKSVEPGRGGPGGSDHTPFIVRGIPAFFGITAGDHPDYHQPSDDWDKIQPEVCQAAGEVAYRAVLAVATVKKPLIKPNRETEFAYRHAALADLHSLTTDVVPESLSALHIDIALVVPSVDPSLSTAEKLEALLREADNLRQRDEEDEDFDIATNPTELRMAAYRGMLEILLGARPRDFGWDEAILRNLARLDYRVLVLSDSDGVWTDGVSLTERGEEAVEIANDTGLLILVENPSTELALSVLEASEKPIVVAGVEPTGVTEDLVRAVKENDGLLMIAYCPRHPAEEIAESLNCYKETLGVKRLGLYRHPPSPKMVGLLREVAAELKKLGWKRAEIESVLGNNLSRVFRAVSVEREMTIQFRF